MTESVTHANKPAQHGVDIVPVTTRRQRRQFVELPYAIYARTPAWVPPLRRDEHRRLDRAHNPFLEHAEMDLWLAVRGGRVVGRIAAIEDRLHNEIHRQPTTWFGFFEAVDEEVAHALLSRVEAWGRARGSAIVRGPANPSLNESAGLLVDAFDLDPYILMPYNPPSYAEFVERAGYRKVKDLFAWAIDLSVGQTERVMKVADRVRHRHGISIRSLDLQAFERDLAIVQELYRGAWQENWGFVPPTDAEIRQLAIDLKPILEPSIVLFAEQRGRPVGCAVAVPDINQVLKRMNGRLLPFGIFAFLRRRTIVTRGRTILVGVLPEMRRIGLYPLLIAELFQRGINMGYTQGELSWTLEDNDAVNAGIEATGGRHYKTYRLYDKPLG